MASVWRTLLAAGWQRSSFNAVGLAQTSHGAIRLMSHATSLNPRRSPPGCDLPAPALAMPHLGANSSSSSSSSSSSGSSVIHTRSFSSDAVTASSSAASTGNSSSSDESSASSPGIGTHSAAAPLAHVPRSAYADYEERAEGQGAPLDVEGMRAELMRVLIHPLPRARGYTGQLSHHMVRIHDQNFIEPEQVLKTTLRALLVIKHTLQEDGHIYIVGNHPLLRPLLHEAAACCVNPNVWWYSRKWVPGTLTNYSQHRRLFKGDHQPNRRLFQQRGVRMVNPLCPTPPPLDVPVPRVDWADKWALFARAGEPGVLPLLQRVMLEEDHLHQFQPPRMLRGRPKRLRLLVCLDAGHNAIALREAAHRGIPTMSLMAHNRDLTHVTYPVLARDFHPAFVHFFLDWVLKVANMRPASERAAAAAAAA